MLMWLTHSGDVKSMMTTDEEHTRTSGLPLCRKPPELWPLSDVSALCCHQAYAVRLYGTDYSLPWWCTIGRLWKPMQARQTTHEWTQRSGRVSWLPGTGLSGPISTEQRIRDQYGIRVWRLCFERKLTTAGFGLVGINWVATRCLLAPCWGSSWRWQMNWQCVNFTGHRWLCLCSLR